MYVVRNKSNGFFLISKKSTYGLISDQYFSFLQTTRGSGAEVRRNDALRAECWVAEKRRAKVFQDAEGLLKILQRSAVLDLRRMQTFSLFEAVHPTTGETQPLESILWPARGATAS